MRTPLGGADISAALHELGVPASGALMVHSSLSACGQIHGGAISVLQALREARPQGSLAMPTHTYCYPKNGRKAPCFDPRSTGSAVGAITERFWRQPGVVRSMHPSHSLACEGPLAEDLCAGHEWSDTPCGRGTPYERLVRHDCSVLLFGVTMDCFTLFHVAEDEAQVPYLYFAEGCPMSYRDAAGMEWSMLGKRHDMTVPRRFAEMEAWLEPRGLLRRVPLGLNELRFIPSAAAVHEAVTAQLRHDPWFLVQRAT